MLTWEKWINAKNLLFPHRDALTISIINSLTSILAGFVIFSAFGYMSYLQSIPVSDLAVDGKERNEQNRTIQSTNLFTSSLMTF